MLKSTVEDKTIIALFVAVKNRLVDGNPDSYEEYLILRGQLKAYRRLLTEMGYNDAQMTLITHEIEYPRTAKEIAVELYKRFLGKGLRADQVTPHAIAVELLDLEPESLVTWHYLRVLQNEMLNIKGTDLK